MYYPTFFCSVTKIRHLVKDRYCYECGQRYNLNYHLTKKVLRNIKFKTFEDITCAHCRSLLERHNKEG